MTGGWRGGPNPCPPILLSRYQRVVDKLLQC